MINIYNKKFMLTKNHRMPHDFNYREICIPKIYRNSRVLDKIEYYMSYDSSTESYVDLAVIEKYSISGNSIKCDIEWYSENEELITTTNTYRYNEIPYINSDLTNKPKIKSYSVEKDTPEITFSTNLQTYLEIEEYLTPGEYELKWSYIWSVDDKWKNFRAEIHYNNTKLKSYIHKEESKNTQNKPNNNKNNQRFVTTSFKSITIQTTYTYKFSIKYSTTKNWIEASIYYATLKITEI